MMKSKKDNYAAGISYGLNFIAMAIFISSYIRVSDSVSALCIWFVISIVVLVACRFLVDKILFPQSSLDHEIVHDRNWGRHCSKEVLQLLSQLLLRFLF